MRLRALLRSSLNPQRIIESPAATSRRGAQYIQTLLDPEKTKAQFFAPR
jgi:hypothetical protein